MTLSKFSALLLILTITFALASDDYDDGVSVEDRNGSETPQVLDIKLENYPPEQGRLLASGSYPQIRIHADYDFLRSAPASYKSYVQYELVPPVIAYFQAALKIKYPVAGTLQLPSVQTSVCGARTPSILLNGGVAADYFIFYDSTYDGAVGWIGDSSVCFMALDTNRPLVTQTKLNRAQLIEAKGDVLLHEKNTYLIMHEMTHVFGFTYSMYPYFVDEYGKTRRGHMLKRMLDGTESLVINVPPLTQRLRNHFGCASLAGAYMENGGASSATAGSHFERRHFINEYMTSGLTNQQRISEFSLAMLEGTGWYIPDYSYAEPYFVGQGQGCGFLFNSCTGSGFNYGEFCQARGQGCTQNGGGGGYCKTDTRSDGCKYYQPNMNFDCQNPNAAQSAVLPNLQAFGRSAGSKCFSGDLSLSGSSQVNSYCFKYSCYGSGADTVLNVQVGSLSVKCREEGAVQIEGYYGSINCPDPLSFCSTAGRAYCPRNCMGRGVCQNGKCACYRGFTGIDCGLNI